MIHRFGAGRLRSRRAAVTLAALAAAAAALAGAGTASAAGATLYVSAATGSDANPCTLAAPCLTIGHAVSVASAGDTIVVEPGTYTEMVTVTTSLTITGQPGAVVDATGLVNGFDVSGAGAAGTTVRGFTVENAIGEGILVESTSNVTVADNVVELNDQGFDTPVTPECTPQGQIPGDCGEGLHLMSVTDSKVVANVVQDNVGGILVTDELGPAARNVIANNVARDNLEDCGITLPSHNGAATSDPSLGGVYDNTVVGNLSEGNGGAGVGMFAPFPGTASYDNIVTRNRLIGNGEAGVAIHSHTPGQKVSGNVITFNTVSGNGVDPDTGSGHPTGIALLSIDPTTTTIGGNRIMNEYYGIFSAGPIFTIVPFPNFFSNVQIKFGRGPIPLG